MFRNVINRIAEESWDRLRSSSSYATPFDPDYLPPSSGTCVNKEIVRAFDTETIIDEVSWFVKSGISSYSSAPNFSGFREEGTDFLAFYKSYFDHGQDWGIYFDVERMAEHIQNATFGDDRALIISIIHHERFHFLVEFFGALQEHFSQGAQGNLVYDRYNKANPRSPVKLVEEAMANAYALTRQYRKNVPGLTQRKVVEELARIDDLAPAGYRDYGKVCFRGYSARYSPHKQISREQFNNSAALFFDAMSLGSQIDFSLFKDTIVAGSALHVPRLLLSNNQFASVPMYLLYPAQHSNSIQFLTPGIKLKKFYRFLEAKYNVIYLEGSKHGKLFQPSTGKKRNAWKRKGSNSDLLPYHVRQAASWLEVSADVLAREAHNF